MKKTKRLMAMFVTLMMALMLAVPTFAAGEKFTITVENAAESRYAYYQVFTGDVNEDGTMDNIHWGAVGANVLDDLKAQMGTQFADCETAADVAAVVATFGDDSAELTAFADIVVAASGMSGFGQTVNGKCEITVDAGYYILFPYDQENEADKDYNIVFLTEDVTVYPKTGTLTSYKKVADWNDTQGQMNTYGWGDSADHDIGDAVSFQLFATLPENLMSSDFYQLTFHDIQSAGLTYRSFSQAQYSLDGGATYNGIDASMYEVVTTPGDGCTFEVIFDDVTAIPGIENGAIIKVEYTSTLNENAVIGADGNPNTMWAQGYDGKGSYPTPEDTVIVFTYQVDVDKVDGEEQPLAGAAFKLEKMSNGDWVEVGSYEADGTTTTFTFTGLDDGDYRLTETTAPESYNAIDPIEFTVTAEHQITSDDPQLTSLNGNVTTGEITFTSNVSNGSLTTAVVNLTGIELPETGGMGTTIFYIIGGVLVIGVVVVLVAKKRTER